MGSGEGPALGRAEPTELMVNVEPVPPSPL